MTLTNDPIRVMVVDDSAVIRGLLVRLIDKEPDLHVVKTASNGENAITALRTHPADVVLLDIEMPVMDGQTAVPLILKENPAVRIIMVSTLSVRGGKETLRALSLGAADYVPKPTTVRGAMSLKDITAELMRKIRVLGRRTQATSADGPLPSRRLRRPGAGSPRILAIGASTGGPNALDEVLSSLPAPFPTPIVIVQHMPPVFTELLAQRLDKATGIPSCEARDGQPLRPGNIYVAPGDHHMELKERNEKTVIRLKQTPPVNYCRPSVDPLFTSVAKVYGSDTLAVVLTGMGEDGLHGCEEIVAQDGVVLAQDEATSVVWGMPGAVARAGLASEVLPLTDIAPHIKNCCEVLVR